MALTTRISLGIATIMALIAVWILPPRLCSDEQDESTMQGAVCGGNYRPMNHQHVNSLLSARAWLNTLLERRLLAESLRQELKTGPSVHSTDGAISVLYQAPFTAADARSWLNLAEAELARVPGTGRHPVVVVLEHAKASQIHPASRIISATASGTTCFARLYLDRSLPTASLYVSRDTNGTFGAFLGVCALVARFGAPGAAVMPAVSAAYLGRGTYAGLGSSVPVAMMQLKNVVPWEEQEFESQACVTNTPSACRLFIVSGARHLSDEYYYGRETGSFLAWLLVSQDTASFGKFWRSPGSFDAAMSSAYGRGAEGLPQGWGRSRWLGTSSRLGGNLLVSLLWLSGAILAAVLIGTRRRVAA
ncbi:MAG TPA: hypothetical protein VGI92_14075 [Gemmatimonadales bacterium]|jgi:hypothetical protein